MILAIGLAIVWGAALVFVAGVEVGLRVAEADYCGKYCSHAFEVAAKENKPGRQHSTRSERPTPAAKAGRSCCAAWARPQRTTSRCGSIPC